MHHCQDALSPAASLFFLGLVIVGPIQLNSYFVALMATKVCMHGSMHGCMCVRMCLHATCLAANACSSALAPTKIMEFRSQQWYAREIRNMRRWEHANLRVFWIQWADESALAALLAKRPRLRGVFRATWIGRVSACWHQWQLETAFRRLIRTARGQVFTVSVGGDGVLRLDRATRGLVIVRRQQGR